MHNFTPEYASTSSMLKPFEKKFLKMWFSPQISSKRLTPYETELKNEEREKEKEKLQKSLQIKGKLTFWEEKYASTSKILFNVIPFSPPPSYHLKNPFQNHLENFLSSFWTIL
jgi:hypothetical protein